MFAVSGLELLYPDLNNTSIDNHGVSLCSTKCLPPNTHIREVSSTVAGSNHWTGSTRAGVNSSVSVVDANLKVWDTGKYYHYQQLKCTD